MKFFKSENGTIFSIKDIVSIQKGSSMAEESFDLWTVFLNVYTTCSGKNFGLINREYVYITQGDYERLVRVLEKEGVLK